MSKARDHLGPIIIILSSLVVCFGHSHDGHLKAKVIEDIVRKVCNISLNAFANKEPDEKNMLMAKIEEKLKTSAVSAGIQGEKYVNLIMRGVRSKAFATQGYEVDDTKELRVIDSKPNSAKNDTNIMRKISKKIERPGKKAKKIKHVKKLSTRSKSKDDLVDDIASKLETLAKTYLKDAKTPDDRKKVIENIKKTFMESTDNNQKQHNKHEDIKKYVDLVAKGIAVMMQRSKQNTVRKMGLSLDDNLTVIKDIPEISAERFDTSKTDALNKNEVDIDDNFKAETIKSVNFKMSNNDNFIQKSACDDAVKETCNKIKLVQKYRCMHDDREIDILKLCDGVGDCLDFSDEQNCAKQAMECIQNTNLLMERIKSSISSNCYPDIVDDNILLKQNKILGDVLQNQFTFLHSHTLDDSSKHSRRVFNSDAKISKKIVNDAVTVVHTLNSVLETSLCKHFSTPKEYEIEIASHKRIDTSNLDKDISLQLAKVVPATAWVSERCRCNGKKCLKECSSECEQTCLNKFSLTQFKCSAVGGDISVPLDALCDGKLDCFDESDESGCSRDIGLAKFEAIKMYNDVLRMLETKSMAAGFESIRSRLRYLHTLVFKLQKKSLKRNADVTEVKYRRDACFTELLGVYETALHYASSPKQLNNIYEYLQSLNGGLVKSLKRSHTGNHKIISPGGCICRSNSCAMLRCTKTCIRACSVEKMLTRYFCGRSSNISESVPLEHLCNGKKNCPGGDDETDCKPDVCRKHHLLVLRHNLRDAGYQQQGTSLGEALRSWRVKVLASIMVAESNERPQPFIIREMVNEVLHDLVMTYASVDDRRRTDFIFKEFSTWSRVVINVLKSCTR